MAERAKFEVAQAYHAKVKSYIDAVTTHLEAKAPNHQKTTNFKNLQLRVNQLVPKLGDNINNITEQTRAISEEARTFALIQRRTGIFSIFNPKIPKSAKDYDKIFQSNGSLKMTNH